MRGYRLTRNCRECHEEKDVREFEFRHGTVLGVCRACSGRIAFLERQLEKLRQTSRRVQIRELKTQIAFLTRANDTLKQMLSDTEELVENQEKRRTTCLKCGREFFSDDPKKYRRCEKCKKAVADLQFNYAMLDDYEVHL